MKLGATSLVMRSLYIDFLIGIGFPLKIEDRVRLLRVALDLVDSESSDFARIFYELAPFLNVDEKHKYGGKALGSEDVSLNNLVVLSSFLNYLPRDDSIRRIRSCVDSLREKFSSCSFSEKLHQGFALFAIQQGLASLVDYESDSVSIISNVAEQERLLDVAVTCFDRLALWFSRLGLAKAWVLYSRALRTHPSRILELLGQAKRKAMRAVRFLRRLYDYNSLVSGYRLLFLICYRMFCVSDIKARKTRNIASRTKHYAGLLIEAAQATKDPVSLAGGYTDYGIALRNQAWLKSRLSDTRQLLRAAREMHLKSVQTVKGNSEESLALHLYNASSTLIDLARIEPSLVKANELHETAARETEELMKLPSTLTQPNLRIAAIANKLHCSLELGSANPASATDEVLGELDEMGSELEKLEMKTSESRLIVGAYQNLARYYSKLLRFAGRNQNELVQKAEQNALRSYEIAKKAADRQGIWEALLIIAEILMLRGILNHDVKILEEAGNVIERCCGIRKSEYPRLVRSQPLAAAIHIVTYGYTGDSKELAKAITYSRRSISTYVSHGHLELAGEESFRLATIYMLVGEDRKAERALHEAAKLFEKSGQLISKFKQEFDNLSNVCRATRKMVRAQIAFNRGDGPKAERLAEQAEKEMIQSHARWREIWLVRGFKELVAGNLDEARRNLERITKESLDVLDENNPISTGYTARRMASFIDEQHDVGRKSLPPAIIDLPLRTDVILAALKLDRVSREILSVPVAGANEEPQEPDVEEIRQIIKRIMEIENMEEKKTKEEHRSPASS